MSLAQLDAQKGKVDREALLGRLLFFTIPEATMLDYQQTLDELGAAGLTKALPKPPREHDTFRRVTSAAEKNKVAHVVAGVPQPDKVENWMVRDVSSDDNKIVRRAVVEVRDSKGHKLDYQQVLDMVYVRPTGSGTSGRVRYEWLLDPASGNRFDGARWPYAQQMLNETVARYKQENGKLASGVVRNWLTKTIRAMGGTSCRPNGGLYFLEESLAGQVETLEAFCAKHLPTGGECHSIELLDSDKQREMVKKAIERETIGSIEEITQEINECRREGKLTSKRFVDIQRRVKAVDRKNGKYMKLLEKDSGAIQARLNLLHNLAGDLGPLQAKVVRKRKPKEDDEIDAEIEQIGEDLGVLSEAIEEVEEEEQRTLPGGLARFLDN